MAAEEAPREIITTHDLRGFAADVFALRLGKGQAKNEIRDIAIMAEDVAKAAAYLRVSDYETAVTNLSIGSIDLRGVSPKSLFYDVATELGLVADGPVRRKMNQFIKDLEKEREKMSSPGNGHGYQNEAVGYEPTRQAFAEFFNHFGFDFGVSETVFSYGSLPAFDGILQVAQILAKREGVPIHLINPEPTFPVVAAQAIRRNIPVISIPTNPDTGYCITAESLLTAFENTPSNARDILYIVPMSNPTSSINDPEVLAQAIAEFHRLRPKGMIIVDVAYLEMIPEDQAKNILSRFKEADALDQCLFVTSLSKLYGDPRGRAGAIHTKSPLFFQELKTQWQTVYASMASAVENEALAKLKFVTKEARQRLFELFKQRQKAALSILIKINTDRVSKGLESLTDTDGIYSDIPLYLFVKLNEGFSWLDLFRETGLVVVPGEVFGAKPEDRMVRIAVGTESLDERDELFLKP